MFESDNINPADEHYEMMHRFMVNSVMSVMLHSEVIIQAADRITIYTNVARISKSLRLREAILGEDIDFLMYASNFLVENLADVYEIPNGGIYG